MFFFFFSSRRRHTRWNCDWSSDVCSSDLGRGRGRGGGRVLERGDHGPGNRGGRLAASRRVRFLLAAGAEADNKARGLVIGGEFFGFGATHHAPENHPRS